MGLAELPHGSDDAHREPEFGFGSRVAVIELAPGPRGHHDRISGTESLPRRFGDERHDRMQQSQAPFEHPGQYLGLDFALLR